MAIVTVRIDRGHPPATKRKLVEALTGALADVLEVPRASVTILIEEYARENWATGGELLSDSGAEKPVAVDLESFFRKPTEKPSEKKAAVKLPAKASPRKAAAKSRSRR
jgi:4-oxalocrotonate tautomerase